MKWNSWDPAILRYFIFRGTLSRVYLPILVIYMADMGLTLPQIAGITMAGKVASFFFEVPSGAVADTLGHRRTLVISQIGQALSCFFFLGGSLPWILVGTLTYFLFGSLLTGTGEALFFEYLKSKNKQSEHLKQLGEGKAFSRFFNMIAVFVGGASYALSPVLPFLICAVQFAVGAIVIAGFPAANAIKSIEKEEGFTTLLKHFPRAIKTIWQHRFVFWLVVLNAILIGSIGGTNDFQQLVFTHLGATTVFIGAVYAVKRVVAMVVASYAHRLAVIGPARVMLLCTILAVAYAMVTPLVSSFLIYGVVVLLASVVYSLIEVFFNDYLNQAIPSLSRATTISVANFATQGVGVLTASFFAWIHLPPAQIYAVLGAAILVFGAIPLLRIAALQSKQ